MKNLKLVLDDIFGEHSSEEKDRIIQAVEKDNSESSAKKKDVLAILDLFNSIFDKKSRVMSDKVIGRYRNLLKQFSIEDIENAFRNAKSDEFHIESGYRYCTLEYFSRLDQMDKWATMVKPNTVIQKSSQQQFVMPNMNTKQD